MPSGLHTWSKSAGSNNTADSTIGWSEGQAPSTINDSARAMMAVVANWRDDNNGTLTTGGTSTAYTLTTNTGFTSLALMNGQTLAFTMNATSGATPTLNVDGLGAKVIRNVTGVALPTGALLSGAVYRAAYNNSTGEWLLLNQPGVLPTNSVATASIQDTAVTYAKVQNVAASKLLGNPTGSPAAPSEITLGSGLSFSSSTLNSSAPSLAGAVGLSITNNAGTPNSKIDLAADQIVMLNSSNVAIFAASVSVTIDTSVTGAANGLDTGSRASSTWYAIWSISNGSTTAGLASLSGTAPTMPSGYTYKAFLGWMLTDGSGNFYRTKQVGNKTQYVVTSSSNTTAPPNIANGAVGTASTTSPVLSAQSVSSWVPTTATHINVLAAGFWKSLGSSPGATVMVAPNAAYSGTNNGPFGSNGLAYPIAFQPAGTNIAVANAQAWMQLESSSIYWASGAIGGAIFCLGWQDKVNAS